MGPKRSETRSFITPFTRSEGRYRLDTFCYKLISATWFTGVRRHPRNSHLHLIIVIVAVVVTVAVGLRSSLCPLLGCKISQHKPLARKEGKYGPSCLTLSLSMKSSCKRVNRKRDFNKILAAYPSGFHFSVDESADEPRTTNVGAV